MPAMRFGRYLVAESDRECESVAGMITGSVGSVGPDGVRVVVENGLVHVIYQNSEDYNLYHIKISD